MMERGCFSGLQGPYEDQNVLIVSEFKITCEQPKSIDRTSDLCDNSLFLNDDNVYTQRSTKL